MVQSLNRQPELFSQGRILVYGLGKSGLALCQLLQNQTCTVHATDDHLEMADRASVLDVQWLSRDEAIQAMHANRFTLLAVSPGIRPSSPLIQAANDSDIPVLGELECAWHLSQGGVIAITGTNGKTTTATLTAALLDSQFPGKVHLAGNIGTAYSEVAPRTGEGHWTVLEVSSFQLHATRWFTPDVFLLLNITPDHLNWHKDYEDYIRSKLLPVWRMKDADQTVIWNADDPVLVRNVDISGCREMTFSISGAAGADLQRVADGIRLSDGEIITRDEILLQGEHNLENVMAAVAGADCCGAGCRESFRAVLARFAGVEHRLEPAGIVDGVEFINDSKATNVASTLVALRAMNRNTHLLLGGSEKDEDFTPLRAAISNSRIQTVHLTGPTAVRMEKALDEIRPVTTWSGFDEAVCGALACAKPGDVILLSPACASFDFFQNFEHRGQHFKKLVDQLAARPR